jgi:hypothetical protein
MLLLVTVFSIPSALSDTGKLVWAFASYALFQLVYSFVNIPYGSLSAMTQDPEERAKLSASRSIAASLTMLAYPLTEQAYRGIVGDIAERRAENLSAPRGSETTAAEGRTN